MVREQVEVGLDIVNDGEFGKESWANYIMKRISGFENRPDERRPSDWLGSDRERFSEYLEVSFPAVINGRPTDACTGPIAYRDREGLDPRHRQPRRRRRADAAAGGVHDRGRPGQHRL